MIRASPWETHPTAFAAASGKGHGTQGGALETRRIFATLKWQVRLAVGAGHLGEPWRAARRRRPGRGQERKRAHACDTVCTLEAAMDSERNLFFIRDRAGKAVVPLGDVPSGTHPAWVHAQLGTSSEAELGALAAGLPLADYLRRGPGDFDARGIFVDIPNGAVAWKLKDPFQQARWLFEDSEVVEAQDLDPELVLRVGGIAQGE